MFPSDTDFETKVTLETEMTPLPEQPPFHILFLGDWSGRESGLNGSQSIYQPIEIDRDNFDEVIKRLNVSLNLDFQGSGENLLSLSFSELEDFHPDRIFQQVTLFDNLHDIRRRLVKANTFGEAAREVRSWINPNEETDAIETNQRENLPNTEQTSQNNLLEQILGQNDKTDSNFVGQNADRSELSEFVKKIVRPHLVDVDTTEQSKLLMIVDEVISDLMRKILHHPQFQALESAWRGLYLLTRRIETDNKLKIYLMDVSKNELSADLKSTDNLSDSQVYKVFFQGNQHSGNEQWSIVCGSYTFSLNIDDVATLIRTAKIASNTNTPFIAHLNPEIFGFTSFGEIESSDGWNVAENSTECKLWTTLRGIPEAAYLGLTMPRFLARLPYGEETEPTETFSFEEFTKDIQHEDYLWINPAFAIALLSAQTFSEFGWNMSQNFFQDIDNLPVHLTKKQHENKTKPCAEIMMTQNNCERMLEQGIMPLISFRDSDRIRLGRFQSIASPFTSLKGKWY